MHVNFEGPHPLVRNLGDVQQRLVAAAEVHKRAKVKELGHGDRVTLAYLRSRSLPLELRRRSTLCASVA